MQASIDVVAKQATYEDALRAEKAAASNDLSVVGQTVHDPAVDQLRTQAAELVRREGELSGTYGPAYPALLDVRARRAKLAIDLRAALKRLTETLRADYEVAQSREAALKETLADLDQKPAPVSLDVADVQPARELAAVLPAPVEASVAKPHPQLETDMLHDVLVVSVAMALVGLSIGFAFSIWRDIRVRLARTPFESAEAYANKGGEPPPTILASVEPDTAGLRDAFILGRIPSIRANADDLAMLVVEEPNSAFALEIERLAARLVPTSTGGHVVGLFPLQVGQGATSLMVCLAEAVALNGFKVLLIDADAHERGMSRALHTAGMRGLAEVLAGHISASKLVLDQNGVTILPAGRIPFDLRRNADAMAALLTETRERFDLILIDASPFDPQTGSTTLCRLCDDFGLVACRDGLPRERFVASVEAAAAFPGFAGILLNREGGRVQAPLAVAS